MEQVALVWSNSFVLGDGAAQTLNDCIMGVFTNPYTGTVSVTNHGFTCQAWSTQYPHRHPYTEDIFFPYDGGVLGASNFCRQIPGPTSEPTGRTWCHTVHPHIVTDFCDLQICDGNLVHIFTGGAA